MKTLNKVQLNRLKSKVDREEDRNRNLKMAKFMTGMSKMLTKEMDAKIV